MQRRGLGACLSNGTCQHCWDTPPRSKFLESFESNETWNPMELFFWEPLAPQSPNNMMSPTGGTICHTVSLILVIRLWQYFLVSLSSCWSSSLIHWWSSFSKLVQLSPFSGSGTWIILPSLFLLWCFFSVGRARRTLSYLCVIRSSWVNFSILT